MHILNDLPDHAGVVTNIVKIFAADANVCRIVNNNVDKTSMISRGRTEEDEHNM